jgi:hypothetical protein
MHMTTEPAQSRKGRPPLPHDQKRRTIGISLSPAALARIQRLASTLGMSQGEYIESILEANADVVIAPPSSWKVFRFQRDAASDLHAADGKPFSKFIDEGWRVEQMFPPDAHGAIDIAMSHATVERSKAEIFKDARTLSSNWVRQYAAAESAVSGIYKSSPHLVVGTLSMAQRLDGGPPVPFWDVEWTCGCYGRRYQPGDIVMLLPCDVHRGLVESWRLPASQPFKRKRPNEQSRPMVCDADIIQDITLAIGRYCGGSVSWMPKVDTSTGFLLSNPPRERVLKVSDDWIAAAANQGRKVLETDPDLRAALDQLQWLQLGQVVFLPGQGPSEVRSA